MPQYKTRNVRYNNKTFTKALPLQLWYWASRLDDITAGMADKRYNLRPADRGMLPFKPKLFRGLTCKLYNLQSILKLARATHLARPVTTKASLMQACMILGISAEGTPKTLRMRIAQHMSCMTVA